MKNIKITTYTQPSQPRAQRLRGLGAVSVRPVKVEAGAAAAADSAAPSAATMAATPSRAAVQIAGDYRVYLDAAHTVWLEYDADADCVRCNKPIVGPDSQTE